MWLALLAAVLAVASPPIFRPWLSPFYKEKQLLIVGGSSVLSEAETLARKLDLPGLVMLRSSDFAGLKPGFFILVADAFDPSEQKEMAKIALAQARKKVPGAYLKKADWLTPEAVHAFPLRFDPEGKPEIIESLPPLSDAHVREQLRERFEVRRGAARKLDPSVSYQVTEAWVDATPTIVFTERTRGTKGCRDEIVRLRPKPGSSANELSLGSVCCAEGCHDEYPREFFLRLLRVLFEKDSAGLRRFIDAKQGLTITAPTHARKTIRLSRGELGPKTFELLEPLDYFSYFYECPDFFSADGTAKCTARGGSVARSSDGEDYTGTFVLRRTTDGAHLVEIRAKWEATPRGD